MEPGYAAQERFALDPFGFAQPSFGDPEAAGAAAAAPAMEPVIGPYLQNVATGQIAAQGLQNINDAFARARQGDPNALVDLAGMFGGAGMAKSVAPSIGKGTAAPLFDLSRLTERPDVPQVPIDRMPAPAKGIPDWVAQQINDPAMREQYKQVLQLGRSVAGDQNALGWWNTFPLRDYYLGEFGQQAGDNIWRSDMNMLSATSPRTDFPQNIKQASYFNNLLAQGQPLPELVKKYQEKNPNAFNYVPTESAPPGYKNFPQHIQNIQNLLQPDGLLGNNYPLSNPKPASMAQNLVGNWSLPTVDVRDLRAMGLQTKAGKPMESVDPASLYGYIENNFHQPLAQELGLNPAQMQSATWVGVPEYFQGFDKSGTSSALGTLEDRIRRTAAAPQYQGMTPEEVLRRGWLRKEFPLLSVGGGLLGLLGLGQGSVDDNQGSATGR